MAQWPFTKGLHEVGEGLWAYIQPNGSWCWSNAGLIVDGDEAMLIDTLSDLKLTREMLDMPCGARCRPPPTSRTLVNTHSRTPTMSTATSWSWGPRSSAPRPRCTRWTRPRRRSSSISKTRLMNSAKGGAFFAELFEPFDFSNINLTKPTRTFTGELDLKVGRKPVKLVELGPAHSKGDIVVYLPEDRAVFTGDILFNGGTPISWAGPVSNWIKACDYLLSLDVDVVGPRPWSRHGQVRRSSRMRGYLQFVYDETYKRYRAGMSPIEAAYDIPLGEYAKWDDADRLVVTVTALYGEFSGKDMHGEFIPFFAEMSKMRRRLKATA